MPTYEYACRKCGEHLEVVQSFTDDPLTQCPNCGGDLKKVFGNIGIVFKGSGFYKTDSRSSTKTGQPKSDVAATTADKPSADKSPGSKSDAPGGSESGGSKKEASSNGSSPSSTKPAASGSPAAAS